MGILTRGHTHGIYELHDLADCFEGADDIIPLEVLCDCRYLDKLRIQIRHKLSVPGGIERQLRADRDRECLVAGQGARYS